jgi:DNA-binding PadR family transcriptional regulator
LKKCELNTKKEEFVSKIEILFEIHERFVKSFLDIIILTHLNSPNRSVGGYDILKLVQKKFGLLLSAGSVYSLLYSMERDGLIRGIGRHKRVYNLTNIGEEKVKTVLLTKEKILNLIDQTFT